jgi:hypothetical protein
MSYNCNECKKKYSSYNSLWNHNKKFHTNKSIEINNDNKSFKCDYCNKYYTNKYILKNHYKTCSIKHYNEQNNDELCNNDNELLLKIKLTEKETELIKLEQMNKEKEILKLKLELKTTQNTTNINNNNIKNINSQLNSNNVNINNNFKIISIGRENLQELLSQIEKKIIMNSRFNCLEELVNIVHCKEYDQFKNILITNLKDDYAYKYCDKLNKFITIKKNEIIHDLVAERLENIREIYEELSTTNKINDSTKKLIKEFLNKMTNEDKYIEDSEGTTYKNFRTYKEHRVKILIYNNTDKISKDLAIILDKPFNDNIIE